MRSDNDARPLDVFDSKVCAKIYLIVALPILLFLAFAIAPLEASDEAAHFLRINALSEGGLLPIVNLHDDRAGGDKKSAGGLVDSSVGKFIFMYPVQKNRASRMTRQMIQQLAAIRPTNLLVYVGHSNTVIYPPLLYVVPVTGLTVARELRLSVLTWLYVARIINAICGAGIICFAIRRSGDAALFLLIGATLPLVLFQQATVSADASLLPLSILFAAYLKRIAAKENLVSLDILILCCTTFLICVGKIAYLPLSFLPLIAQLCCDRRWTPRSSAFLLASVLSTFAWAAWAAVIQGKVFTIVPIIHVDPKQQLLGLIQHPVAGFMIFAKSMIIQSPRLIVGIVGSRLGWMDLIMPRIIVYVSIAVLLGSMFVASSHVPRNRAAVTATILLSVSCYLIIYLLLYLQFNAIGGREVRGVEGRYLTPLIIIIGVMIARRPMSAPRMRLARYGLFGWAGFSSVATAVTTVNHYWAISLPT